MAFDSFRDFLNALDRAGELKRISTPVATELEITELADREMKSPGGGKALLIEKPTVNGQLSPFPVAINTMGSHKRMAMSMGVGSVEEVAKELGGLVKPKVPIGLKEMVGLLSQYLKSATRAENRQGRPVQGSVHRFDTPPPRLAPCHQRPK